MSLPRWDASKQEATITMMELRQQPGEVMDFVAAGGTVHITKQGKNIATIAPHQDAFFSKFAAARPALLGREQDACVAIEGQVRSERERASEPAP